MLETALPRSRPLINLKTTEEMNVVIVFQLSMYLLLPILYETKYSDSIQNNILLVQFYLYLQYFILLLHRLRPTILTFLIIPDYWERSAQTPLDVHIIFQIMKVIYEFHQLIIPAPIHW